MTSLRERQRALVRRTIVEALGELVAETRHLDFSIQEVADRAGVSLRTVYNHFPNREQLLDAFGLHFGERMVERGANVIDQVADLDEVTAAAAINFRIFEELDALTEAWLQVRDTSGAAVADQAHRTERMVELVGKAVPGLDPAVLPLIGLVVRHLYSSTTWHALTRNLGLDVEDAISAVQWAVDSIMEAARRGDLPGQPRPRPAGA